MLNLRRTYLPTFMQIIHSLSAKKPPVLTLGTFDGMHLGHQALLKRLKEIHSKPAVITFENHPLEVLNPSQKMQTLCTLDQKLTLLEKAGIDTVILLPFTQALASMTPEEFLQKLMPFSHLLLGYDARLGNNRQGDPEKIQHLSQKYQFSVEYVPPFKLDGEIVSSSLIRKNLQSGNLATVEKFLGRPFSVQGQVIKGHGKGKTLGFPTANLLVNKLCLPPFGVYEVKTEIQGKSYQGIANLGVAPTLYQNNSPRLEVHLFDFDSNLYDQILEVSLLAFLRPEKKFSSIDKLKEQIKQDLASLNIFL